MNNPFLRHARQMALLIFVFTFLCYTNKHDQSDFPGALNGHGMVFDIRHQAIIIFGGADEKAVLSDTWVYKNNSWRKLKTKGPAARTFSAMVYDNKNDQTILFGGNGVLFGHDSSGFTLFNDTWRFTSGRWEKLIVRNAPPPRAEAAIAFDSERNKIVLYGGYTFSNDRQRKLIRLDDTWEFDGSDWMLISKGIPSARSGATMIYDSWTRKCILFGGNIKSSKNNVQWSWDGTDWKQVSTTATPIYNTTMIFNSSTNTYLRFGGYEGAYRIDSTWVGNSSGAWNTIRCKTSPPSRNHATLVYNPFEDTAYLYGGHDGENIYGDFWAFTNGDWILLNDSGKKRRITNGH